MAGSRQLPPNAPFAAQDDHNASKQDEAEHHEHACLADHPFVVIWHKAKQIESVAAVADETSQHRDGLGGVMPIQAELVRSIQRGQFGEGSHASRKRLAVY